MAHKKKHGGHVPPSNQPQTGFLGRTATSQPARASTQSEASFQRQDPKRRLGDFAGAGEHPFEQPGGKKDANR